MPCYARQERWGDANQTFAEGLEIARSLPHPYAEARILYQSGIGLTWRGKQGHERERLEEALVIFRKLGAQKDSERT